MLVYCCVSVVDSGPTLKQDWFNVFSSFHMYMMRGYTLCFPILQSEREVRQMSSPPHTEGRNYWYRDEFNELDRLVDSIKSVVICNESSKHIYFICQIYDMIKPYIVKTMFHTILSYYKIEQNIQNLFLKNQQTLSLFLIDFIARLSHSYRDLNECFTIKICKCLKLNKCE